jgi:hypothetical protein
MDPYVAHLLDSERVEYFSACAEKDGDAIWRIREAIVDRAEE